MGQPHPGCIDPGEQRTEEGPMAVTGEREAWRYQGDLLLVFTGRKDLHAAGLWQERTGGSHATAAEGIKDAR